MEELGSSIYKGHSDKRNNSSTVLDLIERRLPSIMHPYTITITRTDWISGYSIAIQDAFNLTWKLSLVLKGHADSKLLETYNSELLHIAHQLIDFDKKFAKMLGRKRASMRLSSAMRNVADEEAKYPITLGKRILPMRMLRHIGGWDVHLLDVMPSNSHFYVVVFADDILASESAEREFAELYQSLCKPSLLLNRYNAPRTQADWDYEDVDITSERSDGKVVDLFVLHTCDHLKMELRPKYEQQKYRFYEDREDKELQRRVVKTDRVTMKLVRPDSYVGMLYTASALRKMEEYMDGFVIKRT
ncbi:hypothetical protein W97_01772 [Coniosporium apollinis CBS 100218]|uniref:Uncharacterized protein n=1 Tax=Coniosporium apollinis (strain CBS 100218) TaxID=1168221 RepID=R7YKZ1_CONA1|nr:uncharacterized protein W97_01772 [Coniosporium apollinis CBS 100218]EON62548.1 hypothetical protein W97_01772 [Coniosporium apollinis CBS 100218]